MSAVLGAVDTISSLVGKVWDLMTANPVLTVFVAAGLLGVGVTVFGLIKSAARG